VPEDRRFHVALAASALLHALALGVVLGRDRGPTRPALIAFPVALVAMPGEGGGDAAAPEGSAAEPPAAEAAVPPPVAPRVATRPARRTAPRRVAAAPAPAAVDLPEAGEPGAPRAPGAGPVAAGGGAGGSDLAGGDGSGGARIGYGTNPLPLYPLVARRLGMEGVVLLDVRVAPDGSPLEVRVRESSGFPLLDDAAVTTVRQRWRFLPARQGGTPVEGRVTVPIRFRLEDVRG